ncbi:aldehyde dehydrogenase family protein [Cohnella faecalis]|uniref:aldehyde dehydrogenase family protein n=1 Tax=Cohnella faecalis TaxID=2315694 RepID=UPI002D76F94C|nr:aldehyde dehydrogenase family protein [Cohnella faecalis]
MDVFNPATGRSIDDSPAVIQIELDAAVEAASAAFACGGTPVPRRARILFKYQQLLVEHWDELARLITLENGKTYKDAYGEVQAASNAWSLLPAHLI